MLVLQQPRFQGLSSLPPLVVGTARDPACLWSRDHLSIQNRRVGGYSSTFGREDEKYPTLPADFSTTQILGGHVTSRNQGLCSKD